jgi:hypothetical protein
MAQSPAPVIFLLGAGAFLLASRKKKRRKSSATERMRRESEPEPERAPPPQAPPEREETQVEKPDPEEALELDLEDESFFDEDFLEEEGVEKERSPEELILSLEDAKKKARLGGLYQIRKGDSPLKIAREALYGTRATLQDPDKRDNVIALSILIDCVPWGQANYGRPAKYLKPGHAAIARGASPLGISFDSIYADNRLRMMNGQAPSGAFGNSYAYIWIPMINMDLLDSENIVTTRDMDWPDTEEGGRGHNMIDPPSSVLALGFDDVKNTQVGCKLPDGDFRRIIEVNE